MSKAALEITTGASDPRLRGIEVEAVSAEDFKAPDGGRLPSSEILRRYLESGESSGYAYVDGGLALDYPRLGLTDAERESFLDGLGSAIATVYEAELPS